MKITHENLTEIPVGVKVKWTIDRQAAGAFRRTGEDEWEYCGTGRKYTTRDLQLHLEQYGGRLNRI